MAQRQLQLFVHYLISTIGNEETFLQEFLENFQEILLCSYMESDVINMMNYFTTHRCVTRHDRVNIHMLKYIDCDTFL